MQTNNTNITEEIKLTPAQKLGYKVGDLFEVIAIGTEYYCKGMVVKFITDDRSEYPWFTYVSGPKASYTDNVLRISVELSGIKPYSQEQLPPNIHTDTQPEVQPVYSLDEIKAVMLYAGFGTCTTEGVVNLLIKAKEDNDFLAFIKLKQKYEPD